MNQPSPQDLLEARLTAYALDELCGEERDQVERLLAEGTPQAAAAAREIARMRELGTQLAHELERELAGGTAPVLTPAQRAAISRAANPVRSRPILRWSLAAACAALAAALMVVVLVPGGAPDAPEVALQKAAKPAMEAEEKDGARLARPVTAVPAKPGLAGEAGKQADEQRGGRDAVAGKRESVVAANELQRLQERKAAVDAPPAAAPAATPATAAHGLSAGRVRTDAAGERTAAALADASTARAPLARAAASAAPAAPAPPAAPVAFAAPPRGAAPAAAKPATASGQQEAYARNRPVAGLVAADAAAAPPAPAADDGVLATGDRARSLRNVGPALEEALTSTDKDAGGAPRALAAAPPAETALTAKAARPSGAARPASAGSDEMMSTSVAAVIQVPLHVRTQGVDSVRRCLDAGRLPPPALVRIGDLVDAAPHRPGPAPGAGPAAIAIAAGPCPWQPDHQLLGIVVDARRADPAPRPPLNLALVVDGSAAMGGDDRLPLIKQGLASLVHGLGPTDRWSLVACGRQARLVIDGAGADGAAASLAAISGLSAGADADGAAGAAGLALALEALHRSHPGGGRDELVLCTAGMPADAALADRLRQLALENVDLQLMAVGHDHPEDGALERLAALGHGSFAYLGTMAEAEAALGAIGAPRAVVARQALAEVAFNPDEVASYRLLGAPRMLPRQGDGAAGGGELRAGQAATLLFEVARPLRLASVRLRAEGKEGAADPALVSVQLSYRLADGRPGVPITARLGVAEAAAQAPVEQALAAAAEFGLALRDPADQRYRWERILANAQAAGARDATASGRSEALIDLITRAAALAPPGAGR